jgi:hypothetical protein
MSMKDINRRQPNRKLINKFEIQDIPVEHFLPRNWRNYTTEFVINNFRNATLTSSSITSREKDKKTRISIKTVNGDLVAQHLPWLYKLYTNRFLDIIKCEFDSTAMIAEDNLHGISINLQCGTKMRYECHVESNPITGLLYITDHPQGEGGELVIANNISAVGMEEIDLDCTIIHPRSGQLYIFNGYHNPHYARPLLNELDLGIVVVMNYFNNQVSEADRPSDLDRHLGISGQQ